MNGGLLDIRPPPAAPDELLLWLGLLLSLLLLLGGYLALHYYNAPKRRARRGLGRLRTALGAGVTDNRAAAHALADILRQGFAGRDRAIALPADSGVSEASGHGADFAARLAAARFGPQPCTHQQLQALLEEAGKCLERRR